MLVTTTFGNILLKYFSAIQFHNSCFCMHAWILFFFFFFGNHQTCLLQKLHHSHICSKTCPFTRLLIDRRNAVLVHHLIIPHCVVADAAKRLLPLLQAVFFIIVSHCLHNHNRPISNFDLPVAFNRNYI